jgi:hypothetical protein
MRMQGVSCLLFSGITPSHNLPKNSKKTLAQAPGLSILNLDLKPESDINKFSSVVGCGRSSILRLKYSFIHKLHSSPGDIVKKTEGGPKLENNLVLASLAASSLYGIFLHVALTVCIY